MANQPNSANSDPNPLDPQPVVQWDSTSSISEEETVTFKRSHFYAVLVVFAFSIGLFFGYLLWGRTPVVVAAVQPTEAPQQPVVAATQAPRYTRYDIPTTGFPSLGPDDAPITIVEFSDFQCPFCRRFHAETYKPLLDAYPGKIRFVYRNLPLTSIHPDALPAAIASLCANDQNAYWDYHDKLFNGETLTREDFIQYARDLNLNMDEFSACYDSGKHKDEIAADMDFAINLGIQSTPTFFVNGLAVVGAQPLATFSQLIDLELAGQIP
ncbi:MAG: DsbA family protein [Anaerolineales bacterium]|nr:DsbA family protein [Anaerolineales bacterium]